MMEFLTGVKEQETLELTTLLTGDYEGQSVKLNGAIHTIDVYKRQMEGTDEEYGSGIIGCQTYR